MTGVLSTIWIVDFDGTLFKTDHFFDVLMREASKTLEIPTPTFSAAYETVKNSYGAYDFFEHFALFDKDASKDPELVVQAALQADSYLFPDAELFLSTHSSNEPFFIFTQGMSRFQKAKIDHIRPFLPKHTNEVVTDGSKSAYLLSHLSERNGVIFFSECAGSKAVFIDNAPRSFVLNPPFQLLKQYRVRRPLTNDDKYSSEPTPKGVTEISSLNALAKASVGI